MDDEHDAPTELDFYLASIGYKHFAPHGAKNHVYASIGMSFSY